MPQLFISVLNMSLAGGVVILAVIAARLLLKRTQKSWSFLLWIAAAYRLCCPFSLRSALSIFGLLPNAGTKASSGAAQLLPPAQASEGFVIIAPIPAEQAARQAQAITAAPPAGEAIAEISGSSGAMAAAAAPVDRTQILLTVLAAVWCLGMALMLIFAAVRYIKLKRSLASAVMHEPGVFLSERVSSPFVMGVFRTRIYIPYGLDAETLACVLAHERQHILRGDYLIKLFAFLLLALHWFNPLCWLAFFLMNKDMEMSCDERVLARGENDRRAYCAALLSVATGRRYRSAGQVAFGESAVKSRIKNALKWKKPRKTVSLVAALLCFVMITACATDPKLPEEKEADTEAEPSSAPTVAPFTEEPAYVAALCPAEDDEPEAAPVELSYVVDDDGHVYVYVNGNDGYTVVGADGSITSIHTANTGFIVSSANSYLWQVGPGFAFEAADPQEAYQQAIDSALNCGSLPKEVVSSPKVYFNIEDNKLIAYSSACSTSTPEGPKYAYAGRVGTYPIGLADDANEALGALSESLLGVEYTRSAPYFGYVGEDYIVFIQGDPSGRNVCCVYRSDGEGWYRYGSGTGSTLPITGACILDARIGFICCRGESCPIVYRTSNGGKTWIPIYLTAPDGSTVTEAGSPVFKNGRGAMIVTCTGADGNTFNAWFETTDCGVTWEYMPGK